MNETVWAVMCGAYSDKYLAAIFTDHDKADAYARAYDGHVSEYELDEVLDEKAARHLRPGEHLYTVAMDADGQNAGAWEYWKGQADTFLDVRISKEGIAQRLSADTWATSEQHAIKILNERRSFWLAQSSPVDDKPLKRSGNDYGWRHSGLAESQPSGEAN